MNGLTKEPTIEQSAPNNPKVQDKCLLPSDPSFNSQTGAVGRGSGITSRQTHPPWGVIPICKGNVSVSHDKISGRLAFLSHLSLPRNETTGGTSVCLAHVHLTKKMWLPGGRWLNSWSQDVLPSCSDAVTPERGVIRIWTLAGLLLCADSELRPMYASALSSSCTTAGLGAENKVTRAVYSAQCWNLLNA